MINISDENWEISPAEHFARAEEIMATHPKMGDRLEPHLQAMYIAQRHATYGMVKLGIAIIEEDEAMP